MNSINQRNDSGVEIEHQIANLICPSCKLAGVLHEEPNKHHPEGYLLYCRFTWCSGYSSVGNTIQEAIKNW